MSHGFNSIAKIVVSIISEVFFGEEFTFEFEVSNEREGLHVLIVLQEDVVLDFHLLQSNTYDIIIYIIDDIHYSIPN